MRTTEAAHTAGRILACSLCGQRYVCLGGEVELVCANKHKAVVMRPVEVADSTTRRPA